MQKKNRGWVTSTVRSADRDHSRKSCVQDDKCGESYRSSSTRRRLLGGQFFLFAFGAEQFQGALGFFVCLRDLFLHLLSGFLKLRRELHVAVVLHAGARGDQA